MAVPAAAIEFLPSSLGRETVGVWNVLSVELSPADFVTS